MCKNTTFHREHKIKRRIFFSFLGCRGQLAVKTKEERMTSHEIMRSFNVIFPNFSQLLE